MSRRRKALRYYRSYRPESKLKKGFRLVAAFVVLLFLLKAIVSSLFFSSYTIQTQALLPALSPGDRVMTSPFPFGGRVPFTSWRLPAPSPPSRGDLVVYRPPAAAPLSWWQELLLEPLRFFSGERVTRLPFTGPAVDVQAAAGRIIAVPGDTVRMVDGRVMVQAADDGGFVEERVISGRSYDLLPVSLPEGWDARLPFSGATEPLTLSEDSYFILNDNRSLISDSRLWGPSRGEDITARVLFSYWPRFVKQ